MHPAVGEYFGVGLSLVLSFGISLIFSLLVYHSYFESLFDYVLSFNLKAEDIIGYLGLIFIFFIEIVLIFNFVSLFITQNLQFVEYIVETFKIFECKYILFLWAILKLLMIVYSFFSSFTFNQIIIINSCGVWLFCMLLDEFWTFLKLMNFDFKSVLVFAGNNIRYQFNSINWRLVFIIFFVNAITVFIRSHFPDSGKAKINLIEKRIDIILNLLKIIFLIFIICTLFYFR